jgi:hypothetical protein
LVVDPDGAALRDAVVVIDRAGTGKSDGRGEILSGCLSEGAHRLEVSAPDFQTEIRLVRVDKPDIRLRIQLKIAVVMAQVSINAQQSLEGSDGGAQTLSSSDLSEMADDPDDLERQLQVLAAAAGGAPGQAIITVDGFNSPGLLPPKSSMSFIRVNPDLFSSEYEDPPYTGGRIEVYTKPGSNGLHGALFTNQSDSWMNAADPLASSRAPIGRQRYGFEFGFPIRPNKADFFTSLEHRQIDQFAVVDASTLSSDGSQEATVQNVPTPQSLFEGSIRVGWLPTPTNNITLSYMANVNAMSNAGTGGVVLQEAGFDSQRADHSVRLSDIQTLSANLVHESRIGYRWRYATDTPNSITPSLEVVGAFTAGGNPLQFTQTHERDLEVDDDIILSQGKHMLKAGVEALNADQHVTEPDNFNGTYIFAGGEAPVLGGSGSTVITGIEQYQRAILSQPGGAPTVFTANTGRASLSLNQLKIALYAQDQWKLNRSVGLSLGLRWQMQNEPTTAGNVSPRLGVSWSPDHARNWVLHLRSGLFSSPVSSSTALEDYRLNGTVQREETAYSPIFVSASSGPGVVFSESGTNPITTIRAPFTGVIQTPSLQSHVGVEHVFPRHWHAQANLYLVRAWDVLRSRNINPPLNGSPFGPRPGPANENIDQYQVSGTQHGNVLFVGVDQHGMKRFDIFAGYARSDLRGDADTDDFFPQSSFSDSGETARLSSQETHELFGYSTLKPFAGLVFTTQFNTASGKPFNVTTGFDNNGDGTFNDRPYFASGNGGVAYATPFGELSPSGSGPVISRNAATLPWNVHLDANVSRSFQLRASKSQETRRLIVNVRSANLLNHENVTAESGVLGAPFFLQPYAAGPGRRLEASARFEF